MRRTPYLLLVAMTMVLSASICSCSEDPEEKEKKEQEQDKSVEDWENIDMNGDATLAPRMLFNVGDTIQVEGTVTTRATYTIIDEVEKCLLDENDIVTIEVSAGTGSTRSTAKKNYKVNSNHTDLTYYEGTPSLNEFHWDYGTEKINIRAWSYGGTVADDATPITDPDGQTISVELNQKDNGYKELLYSPQQTDISFSTGKSGISLPLYHQMARVVVTLSKDNSDNPATISLVTIGDGVASIPASAKFHKPTSGNYGTWGDGDNPITWTAGNTIQMKVDDAENGKYSAVLIPATYPKDMKFIYVTMSDNNKYAYILPSAVTLQSGKQYNYTINVKDLIHIDTDEKLTVSDITGTFTYNGSAHTPEPTVKYGTKTLTKDTHYTLSWTNNTNAGTATCTVTGIAPIFTGSVDKTFTINKAPVTVNLSTTSFSINGINTQTFTVTRAGNGNITATSSNTAIATTNVNQSTGVVTVTSTGHGTSNITVNVAESANYLAYTSNDKNVSVSVSIDIRKNPLWWLAQYNMASAGNMYSSHSQSNSAKWSYTDAQSITLSGYHEPSRDELSSIIPSDVTSSSGTNIWAQEYPMSSPLEFSEIACDVGGVTVSAQKSYFGKKADADYYAVRYIGSNYATAWHYKWITSPCKGLLIEAYMIPISMTVNEAKTLLAGLSSSTVFKNTYNASTANQTPASTTVTTNGFVQRFLEANGLNNNDDGRRGTYWSTTIDSENSNNAHHWNFWNNKDTELSGNAYDYYMHIHSHSKTYLGAVRLFKNH